MNLKIVRLFQKWRRKRAIKKICKANNFNCSECIHHVSRRGEHSVEWYKDGKPQYYCYGYIDKMTDELLPECKE